MEKRKPRESIVDELALAKSAAWAWLEHRSGRPDDPPMPEFGVSRTKFNPKQSRYKVEAVRKVKETSNSTSTITACPTISSRGNSNYSLLDSYEIERISRQLDNYIECSRANHHRSDYGGRRAEAVGAAEMTSKSSQKKKVPKGFWLGSHAVMCGSSIDEVVDMASIEYSRPRRRSENGHVAVVDVGCRPRQGIRA